MTPISVNFHLWKPCNYSCKFCFATFDDIKGNISLEDAKAIIKLLKEAGTEKINFAGGEPTLYPNFGELLKFSKEIGLVVSIISNGAKLLELLPKYGKFIDWIGLSVDSSNEKTQAQLGRGTGNHVSKSIEIFQELHKQNIKVKLNTVITSLNFDEDMSQFIKISKPLRWKIFQVLPISGQNDKFIKELEISKNQFSFLLKDIKNYPIVEDNDLMTSSYIMIDPIGRFYNNHNGSYSYSPFILDVGVEQAINNIGWNSDKFLTRGGEYKWA